jgi:hypothetical protein
MRRWNWEEEGARTSYLYHFPSRFSLERSGSLTDRPDLRVLLVVSLLCWQCGAGAGVVLARVSESGRASVTQKRQRGNHHILGQEHQQFSAPKSSHIEDSWTSVQSVLESRTHSSLPRLHNHRLGHSSLATPLHPQSRARTTPTTIIRRPIRAWTSSCSQDNEIIRACANTRPPSSPSQQSKQPESTAYLKITHHRSTVEPHHTKIFQNPISFILSSKIRARTPYNEPTFGRMLYHMTSLLSWVGRALSQCSDSHSRLHPQVCALEETKNTWVESPQCLFVPDANKDSMWKRRGGESKHSKALGTNRRNRAEWTSPTRQISTDATPEYESFLRRTRHSIIERNASLLRTITRISTEPCADLARRRPSPGTRTSPQRS